MADVNVPRRVSEVLDCLSPKLAEGLGQYADYGFAMADICVETKSDDFSPGERAAVHWITTVDTDRVREILVPTGGELKYYQRAPTVFWGHNYDISRVIGRSMWQKKTGKGIKAKTQFATTDIAEDAWRLTQGDFIRTWSIGFIPIRSVKRDDKGWSDLASKLANQYPDADLRGAEKITDKWILLEYSLVGVPANINALTEAVAKGYELNSEIVDELGIDWDEVNELSYGDSSYPDAAFAIVYTDSNGNKIRKLPHHTKSVTDGNDHDTVDKPHLRNALARWNQTQAPASKKKAALAHLRRHARAVLESYQEDGYGEENDYEVPDGKPYVNNHACRLKDPAQFDQFRSDVREHKGKRYTVRYGIKNGKATEQSYLYPKSVWSSREAGSHCRSHGGEFHPAGKGAEEPVIVVPADYEPIVRVVPEVRVVPDEEVIARKVRETVDLMLGRV